MSGHEPLNMYEAKTRAGMLLAGIVLAALAGAAGALALMWWANR